MTRIRPVSNDEATPKARAQLEGLERSLGSVPNLVRTIAHSPAALGAYFGFNQSLSGGALSGALREQIAVAVAGANSCEYCASAHTALGKGAGVGEEELTRNLAGTSSEERTRAALTFAMAVVNKSGFVSDEEMSAVRDAGFDDAEIVEIIAAVAINLFTNYFNHVAQTENDFPRVEVGEPSIAAG